MDLQKKQKNPIFLISVDILQNINFFRTFTISADVPSIYVQQFWNTLGKDSKTGVYSFQLDELWFNLNVDLLRKALGITPKDSAHSFVLALVGDLPWRTILFMINQCLIGKTSGGDRPRHPVLQMLWGVVTGINVEYAELIWEEFVQAIKNFFSDAANLKVPTKNPKPPDDYPLGNLKFVSKGGVYEVFGMPILKDLITDAIRNSEYYKKYLEMAACKPRQPTTMIDEEGGKKKKAPEAGKSKQPAHAKQPKPVKKKTSKPTPSRKIHKGKSCTITTRSAKAKEAKYQGSIHISEADSNSTNDAETDADMEQSTSKADTEILYVEEERGEEVSNTVDLEERTIELDKGHDGSDPDPGQSHVAQAGPNPEPMHEDFIATVYPKVHESLKLTTKEQVHIENPPSSTRTLSLMKNLEDAFTFGDQFLDDKSTEEEPRKANMEIEVESMVTVPIHQASLSVPPLSTPIIDLSPPKPVSPPV
ncbi:hypothetical protein Tco_0907335 [Tanacetum coccineum]|uniref:Monodehydroascorbate reductase n=1 Tax=Tanacetum coccineum TaxID=301880 RepID=A0ABQ5CJ37_9ASTR